MKRGDIVIGRARRGAATKARPCVVVQRSVTLSHATKLTVCPLTSSIGTDVRIRPLVIASTTNGLRVHSQIEVDWIFTEHIEYFGNPTGSLTEPELAELDTALRRWLDL